MKQIQCPFSESILQVSADDDMIHFTRPKHVPLEKKEANCLVLEKGVDQDSHHQKGHCDLINKNRSVNVSFIIEK